MVHIISQSFVAYLTHSSVDSFPLRNITFPASSPFSALIKCFGKFFCHTIPPASTSQLFNYYISLIRYVLIIFNNQLSISSSLGLCRQVIAAIHLNYRIATIQLPDQPTVIIGQDKPPPNPPQRCSQPLMIFRQKSIRIVFLRLIIGRIQIK